MPRIVFSDGKSIEVEYNKAAEIYQVLVGNKELDPKDPKYRQKQDYISRVKEVQFDNKVRDDKPWETRWPKSA